MMENGQHIIEPFQFNPLKHHREYIRHFTSDRSAEENNIDIKILVKELKHVGTSVMDIYTGLLSPREICSEVLSFLKSEGLEEVENFSDWTGKSFNDYRIIALSDTSQWTLKYHNDKNRYIHLFPARLSPHSLRVKANTLKSAILYCIIIGKDYISRNDLNRARVLLGLSPVKDPEEAEAITEMIEMLRE
jgi:hypothetical protein